MNTIPSLSFFIAITSTLLLSCSTPDDTTKPPNIVFILADDLGWADLPMYGNKFNEAPNLTTMANDGMLFTNAYAANPVCSPTRASIQTGQYPARIGINDFLPGHWRPYEQLSVPKNSTQFLPEDYMTIGEALQQTGYKTGYFGKWHLGFNNPHFPGNQGYDESVVYLGGGFFNYAEKMHPPQDFPQGKVLSEALTDLSVNFIEKNKENPFFLFLAHYDVHVQLDADTMLIQKYLNKPKSPGYASNTVYAAMIEHLDNSVGRILAKLASEGLDDNTLIVFFSDNGGLISRFDQIPLIDKRSQHYYQDDSLLYITTSNDPLKAEKGTVLEGGIRVPMIVRWPEIVKAGTQSDELVSSIDFFPTLIAAAGGKQPEAQLVDGIDLTPLLSSEDPLAERSLFWHYPVYHHAEPAGAIRQGEWKLIHFMTDDHLELYNLKQDIGESNNLVHQETELAKELYTTLQNWRNQVNAAMPEANAAFDPEKRYEWVKHPDLETMLRGKNTNDIIPK
jgi:uncharacterized sulfatase